jgi:tetratricopeptide (TPR) repeat protein
MLEKVLELDQNLYEIYYFLGDVFSDSGKFDAASASYDKFLRNFEGYCQQMNQEGKSKKKLILNLKVIDPQLLMEEVLMKRSLCILGMEDFELAIREFNFLIKFLENSSPKSKYLPFAYNKRGYAYFRKHDYHQVFFFIFHF